MFTFRSPEKHFLFLDGRLARSVPIRYDNDRIRSSRLVNDYLPFEKSRGILQEVEELWEINGTAVVGVIGRHEVLDLLHRELKAELKTEGLQLLGLEVPAAVRVGGEEESALELGLL